MRKKIEDKAQDRRERHQLITICPPTVEMKSRKEDDISQARPADAVAVSFK